MRLSDFAVLAVLIAGSCGLFLGRIYWIVTRPPTVEMPRPTEDELLLQSATAAKIITPRPEGGIHVSPADSPLLELALAGDGADALRANPDWQRRSQLIANLYGTAGGQFLLEQLTLLNAPHTGVIAIRDNRLPTQHPSILAKPNRWQYHDIYSVPHPLRSNLIPVAGFHFINDRARGQTPPVGMSDWGMITNVGAGPVKLQTTLTNTEPKGSLIIQLVGTVLQVRLDNLPPVAMTIAKRCPPAMLLDCQRLHGSEIHLTDLPGGTHILSLEVSPISHWPRSAGLASELDVVDGQIVRRKRGPDIQQAQSPAPVTTITDALGQPLMAAGAPNAYAADLGLLPLLGGSSENPRGLLGRLARRVDKRPAAIRLTIDPAVQRATQTALDGGLGRVMASIPNQDASHQADRFAAHRRASLVVLDAETGAILGAARWPQTPHGMHVWDIDASGLRNPVDDPYTMLGWLGLDADNSPGSAFKILVALAGLEQAANNHAIASMLAGCRADASGQFACNGLQMGTTRYRSKGVRDATANFRSEPLGKSANSHKGLRATGCSVTPNMPTDQAGAGHLGLAEATRDSVNVWYARLAELIDGEAANRYDARIRRRSPQAAWPPPPASHLVTLAGRLGLLDEMDLAGLARPLLGENTSQVQDVLIAEPLTFDLAALIQRRIVGWEKIGAPDALQQSAIGGRTQASALHIAVLAAAASHGKRVFPHVIADWGGKPTAPAALPTINANLGPLHAAMKAVPETGTADAAFKHWDHRGDNHARCHLFGKTGTGVLEDASQYSRNTAWFAGWAEPALFDALTSPAQPRWRNKIAFACMVTHGHGEMLDTGGAVCAPIIADLLETLAGNATLKQGEADAH